MKTFIELLIEKNDGKISYEEKLNTIEWKNKRNLIVERDNNCCTKCKSRKTDNLHGLGVYYRKIKALIKNENPFLGKTHSEEIFYEMELGKPVFLHVHHKYYINEKLPWEYSNDALITLCRECHQEEHNNNKIPVYLDERLINEMDLTPCYRCGGSGYLDEYHYYKNGICFRCNGNKYEEFIVE